MPPKKEQVQKVTHLQHILLRPDSYVGSTDKITEPLWVLDGERFSNTQLTYAPALLKIFDEILVNAIDRNSMFPTDVTAISVLADKESGAIVVENNGPLGGISVEQHPTEKTWNPELTFGHLLTSTNYDDGEQRVVGGRNGYGAKLANVFSKKFLITIKDHVNGHKYVQMWSDNMTKCNPPKITKYSGSKSSVNILFIPDYPKFGMEGMGEDFYKIIEKRIWDASVCTSPKCSVSFQQKKIKQLSLDKYAKMYLDPDTKIATLNNERWQVVVAPCDSGFQQMSFVNGICTTKGGTHVEHVMSQICNGIISDMGTKIKLRPQQVKSNMFAFVKSTLVNPSFSSQVKSECTLKPANFGSNFVATQPFIKQVLKTGVQDELIAQSKFREQKELKKTDGARKSKILGIPKLDDANWAGTAKSGDCTLIVTEGDSAKTLAVAGLAVVGRDRYGVFPLRGKCKNVRDASVKQLMANQEFNDLKKILGLQQDKVYTSLSELRYGRLMIMTDADNDGSHIKGLIINMIEFFWPSLLELGFVVSMVTPIIKATKGSKVISFYSDAAFRKWWDANNSSGWKIKYYKGLGTSTSKEAQEYFKNIKNLTVKFEMDEDTHDSVILAFDKKRADHRKQWLLKNTEVSPKELAYGEICKLPITEFINRDLVNFSLADLNRSVAHMVDGFKPSQRKIMFACFKRSVKHETKVAQLASIAAEVSSYHHGEVSMADTIVKLAQNYMGSNNINLLEPIGQFGTRLLGGKDASATRYIFTKLSQIAREMFDPLDDPTLKYLDDDGKSIEPEFYVPRLPMILVNGSEGIGTGFSCYVPPFNPDDIKANILNILNGKSVTPMTPWFKGFKGKITKDDDNTWIASGIYNNGVITELPPGRWTQDFKEHLESLVEKKIITNYKNDSTTDDVRFEVKGYSGKNPVKDFKLNKSIHTSNMHLFHPTKGIKKYNTAEDILVDFVEIRLEYYKKRKNHMIKALTEREILLSNKYRFINMVIEGEIIVFRKPKATLEAELASLDFAKIDDSYDYLMNIKTYQYTEEAVKSLTEECKNIKIEITTLKGTTIIDMWKSDILKC